jgi:hypothetical protein
MCWCQNNNGSDELLHSHFSSVLYDPAHALYMDTMSLERDIVQKYIFNANQKQNKNICSPETKNKCHNLSPPLNANKWKFKTTECLDEIYK